MKKERDNTRFLTWVVVFLLLIYILFILCYIYITEHFTEHFGSTCIDFIPHNNQQRYPFKKDKIFVSVASYRDDECQQTLQSIFKNAQDYRRIIVGICQQNKESSENCNINLDPKYTDQIRQIDMNYLNAKGPTYARYWCSTLWKGEEFFLQIDSHTHFQPNWDSDLIGMFRQCQKESLRPVLSAYPPTEQQLSIPGVPEMCNGKLTKDKIPIFLAGWTGDSDHPKRSPKPFTAAGFMFLHGSFLYNVPFDPNLSHLFQGEETLFSARLFTNGYDFYTPNKKVAWHHYAREGKPKYWEDLKDKIDCRRKAEKRVLFILGLEKEKNIAEDFLRDLHKYGFGNVRTLDDYWMATGIDFENPGGVTDTCNDIVDTDTDTKFKGWNFKLDGYKKINKFIEK